MNYLYRKYFKRLFDLIICISALIILTPIIITVAVLIVLVIGFPILYRQTRPGYLGTPFTILKFRTMSFKYNDNGGILPDDQRLRKFGKFLRSTSIDELPEIWNVIKGDMSIVGPRPLLMQYLDRYTPEQLRRHEVRPGITGWAQINGRNAITWEEKFKLDVWYVDNQSFLLDLKIIFLTIWKIIRRDGINQPGQATMEEFFPVNENTRNK